MKISIITPTLNSINFLPKCMDSILNKQNYQNFEWILVDGGSIDGTLEFIKKNNDNRIKLFHENSGHSTKAYNYGISKATGEIIGTLGSDDVFKPKIFQKIIYYFENKSVFWIVGRNEIINQNNQIVRSIITNFKNKKLRKYCYKSLTINNFFSMQSIFWRKEFMPEKVGYFNEKNFIDSSDYEMWLKMAKVEKPLIVEDIFSYFRVHKTNITSKGSFDQMKQMAEISMKYGKFNMLERLFIRLKSYVIIITYRFLNLLIRN